MAALPAAVAGVENKHPDARTKRRAQGKKRGTKIMNQRGRQLG
jgi:hypothetical protein